MTLVQLKTPGFLALATIALVMVACDDAPRRKNAQGDERSSTEPTQGSIRTLALQSQFSPLLITDAPPGGAHPVGGPAFEFVRRANASLAPLAAEIAFHVTGEVSASDADRALPAIVSFPDDFQNLHEAVAAGARANGVDMGVGLSNMNGHPFGQLLVAGLPFGLEPDEFAAWLYAGGGLDLQQGIYDAKFDGSIVVLPIAITPTQGGGWFSTPLPDPDTDDALAPEDAMAGLCRQPIIVRWPEPGSRIWRRACENVGVATGLIGAETRCADLEAPCPSESNPVTRDIDSLTFGGFVFGGLPHKLVALGHIDAYELNTAYTDVLMMKLATGQADISNAEADLSEVIDAAPFLYGSTWRQPLSYVELLVNRDAWDSLSEAQRIAIETAAQASALQSLATMLDVQDQGIELLTRNGAKIARWPEGLLVLLREAADEYLDEEAARLASQGDDAFQDLLQSQRDYLTQRQTYFDLGDVNQGRSDAPTSPR